MRIVIACVFIGALGACGGPEAKGSACVHNNSYGECLAGCAKKYKADAKKQMQCREGARKEKLRVDAV